MIVRIKKKLKSITLFFYKNLVYKNIKASKCLKIKNILRTHEAFKLKENFFAIYNILKILRKCLNSNRITTIFYHIYCKYHKYL